MTRRRYITLWRRAWSSPHRHTLRREVTLSGVGVHSGRYAHVKLKPTNAPRGFILNHHPLAHWRLTSSSWATRLKLDPHVVEHASGLPVGLSTPEHLLAALYGAGIDDVEIEVTPYSNEPAPISALEDVEVPIIDGSAFPYLEVIEPTLTGDVAYQREVYPLPELHLRKGHSSLASNPNPRPGATGSLTLELTTTLSELYPELLRDDLTSERRIALQTVRRARLITSDDFAHSIAPARTFGLRAHEVQLSARGLIRGVSSENTLIIDHEGLISAKLRHPDELAAHKLLDALGDLALSGRRWRGHLALRRGSHALNHLYLRRLNAEVARDLDSTGDSGGSDERSD